MKGTGKIQKKAEKSGKGSVDKALTMGTAAGAGAGLFGADLMLAAATTFGTTAAGVSISSLSGAAAKMRSSHGWVEALWPLEVRAL